jgi:hypothetical protein
MANQLDSNQTILPHRTFLILSICLTSALLIYLVYTEQFIFGSETGDWIYPYFEELRPIPAWIPVTILVLLALLIFIGEKLILRYEKLVLLGCLLITIAIQLLVNSVYRVPGRYLIKSDTANTFYSVSLKYSPLELLSRFKDIEPTPRACQDEHAGQNPVLSIPGIAHLISPANVLPDHRHILAGGTLSLWNR